MSERMRTPVLLLLASAACIGLAPAADARGVRGGTATSLNRGQALNTNVNRNANINRNTNVNRNVNVNRDINVDVDNNWDRGWRDHPVAAGVAFGTAAAVTAAAIGSVAHSIPPSCAAAAYPAGTYYSCSGIWYRPQYLGTSVTYVVVEAPR